MKIACEVKGFLYKKLAKEYEMNGRTGTTYMVMLDQGETIETLKVNEEIYNCIEQGNSYTFSAMYNSESQYAQFAVRSVLRKEGFTTTGTMPGHSNASAQTAKAK